MVVAFLFFLSYLLLLELFGMYLVSKEKSASHVHIASYPPGYLQAKTILEKRKNKRTNNTWKKEKTNIYEKTAKIATPMQFKDAILL